MKKMKKNIGILFPLLAGGGVFQYALSVANALIRYSDKFNYYLFYYDSDIENFKRIFKEEKIKNVQFICLDGAPNNILAKLKFLFNIVIGKPLFIINKHNRKVFRKHKIDCLIIPFPLLLGFENKIPYIVSIPDIMHKYYPGFPEYSLLGRIKRDIVYKISARYSLMSVVDSQQGLEDLNKFYKIPKKKIKIIPYVPPGYIYEYKDMNRKTVERILKKYNLPEKFLFYPAQFWFHKNHLRLVKAISEAQKNQNEKINLVLAGSAKTNYENYQNVMELAEKLGIKNQIFHLGYVSDAEIAALYKKSLAFIFPTLIGPTSIPPLEAMVLETPVLCSNLFSMPEQIGDAGLLFNPFDTQDIADKIHRVYANKKLRQELIYNGRKKAQEFNLTNYAKKWEDIIEQSLYTQKYK